LPFILAVLPERIAVGTRIIIVYGSIFLGLISLLSNRFSVSSKDDLRKIKVIFWGTVVGVTPAVFSALAQEVFLLLKRSARYFVVQRGFVILILVLSVGLTLWFGQAFSRHFPAGSKTAIPVGCDLRRFGDLGSHPSPSPRSDEAGPRFFPQFL
jgi:hypothetical protein